MSLKLLNDKTSLIPSGKLELELETFCHENNLDLTFEWKMGQYWLHSDLSKERPISIEIDRELSRHEAYFKKSSLHKELLARAIGIKGSHRPFVLDLTAGLLGDGLLFLSMGCRVLAVERNPVVGFIIQSALANARHPLLSNFTFRAMSAGEILQEKLEAEVIFFDPMFEDANEKTLPKKEMRIFRHLVGEDGDSIETFKKALAARPKRLVVKRPRLSIPLTEGRPLQYVGKATRYDVYLAQNNGPNVTNPIK